MKRARRMLSGVILVLVGLGAAVGAEDHEPVAIVGGTVHTVSGESIPGGTVILKKGKVAAVGPDVRVPSRAKKIDVTGLHVYPGLINADTVLGLVEISAVRATLDMSETGTINPGIRAEIAVNPDSELIRVARANGVVYVRTAPRGGLISGTSALVRLDGWTWADMTVVAPLALHVEWPRMRIDRRPDADPGPEEQERERDERIRELKEAFETSRAYLQARDAAAARTGPPVPADSRWEAMRGALAREIPVVVDADSVEQIEAAVAWADEAELRMILSGGQDAWRAAELLAEKEIPVILGPTLSLPRRAWEPYDTAYANAARLHEAGVRFCFSTGGSGFAASNARNVAYHAAMAEAFGLPGVEALRAITLYPAQILGVGDRLGSIDEGKDATIILTDGDPLDIRTNVLRVWIDGHEVSLDSRHTRLYERYKARP